MNYLNYNTKSEEPKRGQHLQREERGIIWQMNRAKHSDRAIARTIGCSPSTIGNELRRGTPPRISKRGRAPSYSPKRGQRAYNANGKTSHRLSQTTKCSKFLKWVTETVKMKKWSLDVCVGYANRKSLFPNNEMVSVKTLYNYLWSGQLELSLFDVPEVLKRKKKQKKQHNNVQIYGDSMELRPAVLSERTEFGLWEWDTVVGRNKGKKV